MQAISFLFVLFARIIGLPGDNVWKSEKPLSLTVNITRIKRKLKMTVLRNDNKIKTAKPISMILVSFFSEDNVLSDEIKICYIFEYQSNENRAFRFLRDTRYKCEYIILIMSVLSGYMVMA